VLVCPWTRKAIEKAGLTYGFPAAEIAGKGDLEEILALQKKAFSTEADCIGTTSIPPMMQTMEDITAEYDDLQKAMIFMKIVQDRIIAGSVRAYEKDGTCYKGARFELFTRADNVKNIGFYKSLGYNVYDLRAGTAGVKFAYLEKTS
jgi:hypothetical protein